MLRQVIKDKQHHTLRWCTLVDPQGMIGLRQHRIRRCRECSLPRIDLHHWTKDTRTQIRRLSNFCHYGSEWVFLEGEQNSKLLSLEHKLLLLVVRTWYELEVVAYLREDMRGCLPKLTVKWGEQCSLRFQITSKHSLCYWFLENWDWNIAQLFWF